MCMRACVCVRARVREREREERERVRARRFVFVYYCNSERVCTGVREEEKVRERN